LVAYRTRLLNSPLSSTNSPVRADPSKSADLDTSALDQELAKIERRLAIDELVARASADAASSVDSYSLIPPAGSVGFAVVHGKPQSFWAAYPSEVGLSTAARPVAAVVIAAATVLLVWITRRRSSQLAAASALLS